MRIIRAVGLANPKNIATIDVDVPHLTKVCRDRGLTQIQRQEFLSLVQRLAVKSEFAAFLAKGNLSHLQARLEQAGHACMNQWRFMTPDILRMVDISEEEICLLLGTYERWQCRDVEQVLTESCGLSTDQCMSLIHQGCNSMALLRYVTTEDFLACGLSVEDARAAIEILSKRNLLKNGE
jgi:hypothetical protein